MTKTITVSSTVDDSKKLQTLINNTGNTPTEYIFSADNDIEIISPIRFYDNVKAVGGGAFFFLRDNAPTSLFPSMTPLIGAKSSGGSGFEFSGLTIDGNSKNQSVIHGKGYHNAFGFSGASGISIHDNVIQHGQGDGARLTNVTGVKWWGNRIIEIGHDGLYVDGGSNVEAWGNYTELRTNSALRMRHVQGARLYYNKIINRIGGGASCPGIQIENSTAGRISRDIIIENNEIKDTWGPGIWVIGTSDKDPNAASGLTIKNNVISNCGNMDSGYHHIPGVGGIVADGFNLDIQKNKFVDCMGYSVLFGNYRGSSAGSGYRATVTGNEFKNTRKSNEVGTASGSAIANLIPAKYTVIARGNKYSGNVRDLYNVTETPASPIENPAFLKVSCLESQISKIKNIIANRTILRKLEK